MNKKKLSVVMAGAMLASSVAPVLAADLEKSEYSAAQLGLLKKELRELLESKTFHSTDKKLAGQSVYYVTKGLTGAKCNTVAELDTLVSSLKTGDKVYVWSEGFRTDEKGNYFSTTKEEATSVGTYSKEDLAVSKIETEIVTAAGNNKFLANKILPVSGNRGTGYTIDSDSVVEVEAGKLVVVKLKTGVEVKLSLGANKIDFEKAIDKDGYAVEVLDEAWEAETNKDNFNEKANNVVGFDDKKTSENTNADIAKEQLKEITITTGGNDLAVSDLYDGLMLTEKGHEFLNQIKYYDKVSGNQSNAVVDSAIKRIPGTDKYTFNVEFKSVAALSAQNYTITGNNKEEAEILRGWLANRLAKVDILAGSNRYETAVNIAKEQVFGSIKAGQATQESNIVLVNGNSLVDGLSAAPLAASLGINKGNTSVAAPILLTEADALPKATKAYLKELVGNKVVSDLKTTIHLVGGESVLNKSLEKELKELGFKVERHGGDNREETSLEVAKAMGTVSDAFVVGAEGEADAMSIAAKASELERPIIVSKKGGITEDAIDTLKDVNVTVIGGENAVSKVDYEAVKAEANSINRIAGSNRQATNALIIEKYYGGSFAGSTKNVIVAKDGQNNKSELIDALSAANLASQKNAPVVLATNKLSTAQINALELNAKDAATLYQVGNGVARDVVKTIAQRLGLAK